MSTCVFSKPATAPVGSLEQSIFHARILNARISDHRLMGMEREFIGMILKADDAYRGKELHAALVQIFGAEPELLVLTSPDHFDITANFRRLCLVAGGAWAKLVEDLDAKIAERKTYKDPGLDTRLKEEAK